MTETFYTIMDSPVGPLLLAGDGQTLSHVRFSTGRGSTKPDPGWQRNEAALDDARRQLQAYFDGTRTGFDLPLAPSGNAFQQDVWRALLTIPYGQTCSYGEIARQIGRPGGAQAVGAANGANPIPIIIPCHRVIGADGSLVGFGGGLPTKIWLLAHERGGASEEANGQMRLL